MRLANIEIENFKRFTNLKIVNLPKTAKLIVLAGPNGSGKSSFFDALNTWNKHQFWRKQNWDEVYHRKDAANTKAWNMLVNVSLHDPQPQDQDAQKLAFYFRTAYRYEADFVLANLRRTGPLKDTERLNKMIESDQSVARNYARLASQALEAVFENEAPDTKIGDFRIKTIGRLRNAMLRLFPDLELNSLGNPLEDGTFKFDKGTTKNFFYKNLSAGEKSAFDILLDLHVATHEYKDTVFCIDEPESHMHASLQSALLDAMLDIIPDTCQLIISTHAIGMMRRARDIDAEAPGSVAFLNFGGLDFDKPQRMQPSKPNRLFWQSMYGIALDDLSALIAPKTIVICEGSPKSEKQTRNNSLDAKCFDTIFANSRPDVRFLSGGNHKDVESDRLSLAASLDSVLEGTEVIRLVDRDDKSASEIDELAAKGVKVLSRRNLESYLFDDEVLKNLCLSVGEEERFEVLARTKKQLLSRSSGPPDDIKVVSGKLYNATKHLLSLTACGNTVEAFKRDTLAPLVHGHMRVFKELEAEIFGDR